MGVKIGDVEIRGVTCLAPLAGMTDRTFRTICREAGASLAVTEMVSARGLVDGGERSYHYLDFQEDEHPVSAQLFGSDAEIMAEAACIVAERKPDMIDVNCGCPARKVVKQNAGAALLRDLPRLGKIISAMVRAVDVPVTVKIRSGWDDSGISTEVARVAEAAGAAAIAVHARTQKAGFSGDADWDVIRQVKQAVAVPVLANGDVRDPEAARKVVAQTGCDMVMVGRWAVGNPWIFGRTETYLGTGTLPPEPVLGERIDMAIRHLRLSVRQKGLPAGVREMRRHLAAYVKGMRGAAACRRELMVEDDASRVEEILLRFQAQNEAILAEEGV